MLTFFLLGLAGIAFLFTIPAIWNLRTTGKALGAINRIIEQEVRSGGSITFPTFMKKDVAFKEHRKALWRYVLCQVMALLLIEGTISAEGGRWGTLGLFYTHIFFVAVFVTTFVLMLFFNGERAKNVHVLLGGMVFCFYGIMALTGVALVVELFLKYT